MNSLFGISMDTIMVWLLAAFLVITVVVAVLAVLNPLFFRLGLRNIPRRRAQTTLIIVGLMLSTVIVTSAFSTGDTVSYSIRSATIANLGNIDESVTPTGAQIGDLGSGSGLVASSYVPVAVQQRITNAVAGNENVDGITGVIARSVPLQDLTSGQTKNQNVLAGIPPNYPESFGPLTTTGGTVVTLSQLGPGEVYLNSHAADSLSAHAGDTLQAYIGTTPVRVTVRAILQSSNLASGGLLSNGESSDPTILMPLSRVQSLLGMPGAVTTMLITNHGNSSGGYSSSDVVTNALRALLANDAEVVRAKTVLASNAGKAALATLIHGQSGSTKTKLQQLQTQVALPGVTDSLRSLLSDTAVSDPLTSMKAPVQVSAPLNDALASISDYHVEPLKKNGLDAADLFGSIFATFFVAFSLFSIAAGVMLIFLIFTMLAAERRPEMGMARAVGTKRRHLIEQFLFEGYVYDLGAALVGMVLGIGVGLGMVRIMAALLSGISSNFSLVGHIEPRSLVVSFCLGALVTFLTVTFASVRVSRLNVVAAIRDLPESFGVKTNVGHAWQQTRSEFGRIFDPKQRLRLVLWVVGIVLLVIPHATILGILYLIGRLAWYCRHLFGAFLSRGFLFLLVGIPLVPVGIKTGQEFFFGVGGSFVVIGVAMLIRWILHFQHVDDAIRNRIGYSLAGVGLVVYWLLPFDFWSRFGVPTLNTGPEMFFVAGILLVIGAVWTVMYNVDIILGALLAVFGRFGHLAPVIKMAVSYPMQHKFRTGLTLAMFSLVIFTLMFMSAIVGSTSTSLSMDRDAGGYQIYGAANPNNPIQGGVQHAIATNPALKDITSAGSMAKINVGLRQPGQQDQSWQPYIANVVDDAYLAEHAVHSPLPRRWIQQRRPGLADLAQQAGLCGGRWRHRAGSAQRIERRRLRHSRRLLRVLDVLAGDDSSARQLDGHRHPAYGYRRARPARRESARSDPGRVYGREHADGRRAAGRGAQLLRVPRRLGGRRACHRPRAGQNLPAERSRRQRIAEGVRQQPGRVDWAVRSARRLHGSWSGGRYCRPRRRRHQGGGRAPPGNRHAARHRLSAGHDPDHVPAGVQLRGHPGHAAGHRAGPACSTKPDRSARGDQQQHQLHGPLAAGPGDRGDRVRCFADHHLSAGLAGVPRLPGGGAALRVGENCLVRVSWIGAPARALPAAGGIAFYYQA